MAGAAGIDSDDFFDGGPLKAFWTERDPQTDGTVAFEGGGTSDARVVLSFPSGDHQVDGGWAGLAIDQPATNDDFEIEIKCDELSGTNQTEHGIIIFNAAKTDYICLAQYRSVSDDQRMYAGRPAASEFWLDEIAGVSTPFWLKVTRTTNSWDFRWSNNGTAWNDFLLAESHTMTVASVGVYVANYGAFPAHSMLFDYFFENDDRIDPEDTPSGARRVMVIS